MSTREWAFLAKEIANGNLNPGLWKLLYIEQFEDLDPQPWTKPAIKRFLYSLELSHPFRALNSSFSKTFREMRKFSFLFSLTASQ